jgi:hypothetical protein
MCTITIDTIINVLADKNRCNYDWQISCIYLILRQSIIFISLSLCASSWVGMGCGFGFDYVSCPYPSFDGPCCVCDLCFSYGYPSISIYLCSSLSSFLFSYLCAVNRFRLCPYSYLDLGLCLSPIVLSNALSVLCRVPALVFIAISPVPIAPSSVSWFAAGPWWPSISLPFDSS